MKQWFVGFGGEYKNYSVEEVFKNDSRCWRDATIYDLIAALNIETMPLYLINEDGTYLMLVNYV